MISKKYKIINLNLDILLPRHLFETCIDCLTNLSNPHES